MPFRRKIPTRVTNAVIWLFVVFALGSSGPGLPNRRGRFGDASVFEQAKTPAIVVRVGEANPCIRKAPDGASIDLVRGSEDRTGILGNVAPRVLIADESTRIVGAPLTHLRSRAPPVAA